MLNLCLKCSLNDQRFSRLLKELFKENREFFDMIGFFGENHEVGHGGLAGNEMEERRNLA